MCQKSVTLRIVDVAVCRAVLEWRAGLNRICGLDSQSAVGSECKGTSSQTQHPTLLCDTPPAAACVPGRQERILG